MPLPLIPIVLGGTALAAGAALHAWLTGKDADPWEESTVFNARMRDMQGLGLALNDGFANCKPFLSDPAQLSAWRTARDGFSQFYKDTGTVYLDPSEETVAQAKSYASKFYFWVGEYNRLKCGGPLPQDDPKDPYAPPAPAPNPTDWGQVVKWAAIGVGTTALGLFLLNASRALRGR